MSQVFGNGFVLFQAVLKHLVTKGEQLHIKAETDNCDEDWIGKQNHSSRATQ